MDSPFREVTFGEEIFSEIDSNEYLNTIYESILYNYSTKLFKLDNDKLKDVNVEDALRFADILSKSTGTRNADSHKIWAQEIVALLNNIHPDNEQIKYYMGSILSNTGNYRGMDMMTPEYKEVSLLDRIYSEYNMEYLTIPVDSDMRFFPAQKQVYDNLGREFFSYSAPTSMGKSFMMRMFIKRQIMDGKQMNFAILVPTKALINEVYGKAIDDLKELLEKYDYGIATSAGDITMKLKKNHIFVMTPERMLYLLISDKTLHLDYLFIDEAHKITSRDKRSAFYYKVVDMLYRRTPRPHFIFASPNIPNPEVYLELIPEAQILPDSMLASGYSPVSQLKYYIDFVDLNAHVYNTHKREYTYLTKLKDSVKLEQIVSYVGGKTQNIVYCSSTNNAVQFARSYAKKRKKLNNEKLNALARDIRNEVHTDYYLSELIETGVAYHIGYLPADIRLRIEAEVPRQKLSVVTELNSNQKDKIVAKLLEGSVEFERTTKDQTTDEYDLMRKIRTDSC